MRASAPVRSLPPALMDGPRLLLLAALAALALPSSASAADLVIQWARLRSERWTAERGLHVGDPTAKLKQLYPGAELTVGAFWLYKAYDAFVQGDAPIVTAQMKGGAVDFIRTDVNPPK